MDGEIYTKEELFEDDLLIDDKVSINDAYQMIKNKNSDEKLKKIKFVKNVYFIKPNTNNKVHVGWLLSPYHFICCNNRNQLYHTCGLKFSLDTSGDIILNNNPNIDGIKIYGTTFNVNVSDAYSHDVIDYRVEHWLHKEALDSFPLHISMTCNCGKYNCSYDGAEFYYNSSEDFYLHKLNDKFNSSESNSDSNEYKIPLVKVNISIIFNNNDISD